MSRKAKKTLVPPADDEIDPVIDRLVRRAQIRGVMDGVAPSESEDFHVAKLLQELKFRRLGIVPS